MAIDRNPKSTFDGQNAIVLGHASEILPRDEEYADYESLIRRKSKFSSKKFKILGCSEMGSLF